MRNRLIATLAAAAASIVLVAAPAIAKPDPNVIVGTRADDRLVGTKHQDIIIGFPGNDRLFGFEKPDVLLGGLGRDVLRAAGDRAGGDVLRGGLGRDRCVGNFTDTFINCEVIIQRG